MAEFSKLVITAKGQALIAKMIAGVGNIEFTKVSASSTTYTLTTWFSLLSLVINWKAASTVPPPTFVSPVIEWFS